MKPAGLVSGLLAVLWGACTTPALGQQRIQFPTPVSTTATTGAAPAAAGPTTFAPAPSNGAVPYGAPAPAPTGVAPSATTASPPAGLTYGSVPGPAPTAPVTPTLPPSATGFGAAPMATLNGTIQPPPATWDPYAPPGAGAGSGALLQQDPYLAPGQLNLGPTVTQMQRLLRDVELEYRWFAGHGSNVHQLGINEFDTSASFAFPFLRSVQTPLVVTPGFAMHLWDGPQSVLTQPSPADMPPQTFDAYLDTSWDPQFSPAFGAELDARISVSSDFRKVTTDSLRVTGKGMAVLTLSQSFKFKAGVWYLDRVHIKLLPAGGVVWTPNPDLRFDILFPNPRVSRKFSTVGNTEWWWFLNGEYGGGTWTIKRAPEADPVVRGTVDLVDYNDIRVGGGLEFKRINGLTGKFEAGYSCDRELVYRSQRPKTFRPEGTFYLDAGFMY